MTDVDCRSHMIAKVAQPGEGHTRAYLKAKNAKIGVQKISQDGTLTIWLKLQDFESKYRSQIHLGGIQEFQTANNVTSGEWMNPAVPGSGVRFEQNMMFERGVGKVARRTRRKNNKYVCPWLRRFIGCAKVICSVWQTFEWYIRGLCAIVFLHALWATKKPRWHPVILICQICKCPLILWAPIDNW